MKERLEKLVLKGVCTFYSETGTEGGYWAFQDEKFMGIPNNTENCAKCGYFREFIEKSLDQGKAPILDYQGCKLGGHEWKLAYPDGVWSYEGLHILEDDDKMIIFDKGNPEKIVWKGTISLKQLGLFTDDAFGMWIHSDQIGIEREVWARWFMEEYPAKLEKKKKEKGGEQNE